MNVRINNLDYCFEKGYRNNQNLRERVDVLAKASFGGLSFKKFYNLGLWTDNIVPYTLFRDGKAVSNLLVCILEIKYCGQKRTKKYIQIGTVMTDKDYRNLGLSRYLMEVAISEWLEKIDAVFLFANDSVLNFYPKFDFVTEHEYNYSIALPTSKESKIRRLSMDSSEDRELLLNHVKAGNPFSSFWVCSHEYAMFNCTMFFTDCIFYLEDFDTVAVFKEENDKLYCYDIFGNTKCSLMNILSAIPISQAKCIVLGFTPIYSEGFTLEVSAEKDTTLFVLSGKENVFKERKLKFPVLSHT